MRWDEIWGKNILNVFFWWNFHSLTKKNKCLCSHKTDDGNNMTIEEKRYFNAFESEHKFVGGAQYFCKRTQKFCE